MTWSITPSKIDRRPVVKWNDKRLCHLDAAEFEAAVLAANALGEVVCMDAIEVKAETADRMASQAEFADRVVRAVMEEMARRDVDAVERPAANDDDDETEQAGSDRHEAEGNDEHPAG